MKYYLGIDCGSVSIKGVVINENNEIIKSHYTKNIGLLNSIKEVLSNLSFDKNINGAGITGSGREFISKIVGGDIIESEIIAHYHATIKLFPEVKTIIDIGGEDCKLMIISNGNLISFQMNRDCGGGTGAMIESIANRMGIRLEDIGDLALQSKTKVSIPSKCGVFAQSAVVSKLNKGIPKEDILMGVCRGLVGNYFTMLAKGVRLSPPFIFQGATAKNKALIRCIEEELREQIIVPPHPELMGAIGMALLIKEEIKTESKFRGFYHINNEFNTKTYYGKMCINECEITEIYENGNYIGTIGNRCEKCIRKNSKKYEEHKVEFQTSVKPTPVFHHTKVA
jgi:predicted CoA-substrate-specific enzyme activase